MDMQFRRNIFSAALVLLSLCLLARAEMSSSPQATTNPQTNPQMQGQPTRLEFAAVLIKLEPFVIDRASPSGFVCHGTDGTRRPINQYLGFFNQLVAPQGRCVGNRVVLKTLIGFAYGISPDRVLQLPDWAQMTPQSEPVVFQVEAVAEATSTTTVEQLRQMVQAMLADRFKLSFHWETQDIPGYALVVAKHGPKLKPKDVAEAEELPYQEAMTGRLVVKGKSTLDKLAEWLSGSPGSVGFFAPVINKTGLTALYDYEFVLSDGGGGGQRGQSSDPLSARPSAEELHRMLARRLSDRLEDQLGLRLKAERTIPVRSIVIDHAEKPDAN
jgi:uncharacterized protein (TIGR03435 family)